MTRIADRGRATLVGAGAIALWATFALLTALTAGLPPFQTLALAFAIAGAFGLAFALRDGRTGLARLRQPPGVVIGGTLAFFAYHALYFYALKHAPVVEASLINYLWPLLIVVFVALLPGGRVGAARLAGATLGLGAAALLVTRGAALAPRAEHAAGYAAALGAALAWSAYSVWNRRNADVPSTALAVTCVLVALLGGVAHLLFEDTVTPTPRQWIGVAGVGLGPSGVAYLLWDHAVKRGDLALLGVLSYAAPVLSTLLLLAFGQAEPHWTQGAAVAMLLAGGWLGTRSNDR
jgi:drug/metabolite transporter (DMT)-like permease